LWPLSFLRSGRSAKPKFCEMERSEAASKGLPVNPAWF
jgi:hypothetical protein